MGGKEITELIVSICSGIIALVNLCLIIAFFRQQNKINNDEKERDRKIDMMQTLVLNDNIIVFHETFRSIELMAGKLSAPKITTPEKKEIEDNLSQLFINLREDFYELLSAIDENLYSEIKKEADDLQSVITTAAFDDGIILSHAPMFESRITAPIKSSKSEIIRLIYKFRG